MKTNTIENPLETLTEILNGMKLEIQELRELRDSAEGEEYRQAYQDKVTAKVDEYNEIVKKF